MPLVVQILMISAMLTFACSYLAARAAWPKFRNLERRGVITQPIAEEIRGNPRGLKLLWFTKIPEDRPQLLRLVLTYRLCQVAAVVLMVTSLVVWHSFEHIPIGRAKDYKGPPPVTLNLSDQDQ